MIKINQKNRCHQLMTPIFFESFAVYLLTDFECLAGFSTEIYISSSLFWPFL